MPDLILEPRRVERVFAFGPGERPVAHVHATLDVALGAEA